MSSRAPVILTKFRNLGEQMKKIVKMSLVAAVAVAGLTAANAKPLEEAIKNVDVSGSVVYRYDDSNTDRVNGVQDTNTQANNYKIGVNLKSKVNDDVTANFRVITATGIASDGGFASLNTATASDANPSLNVSNVYFGYTGLANTTVNVGKQGLATPWTVATDINGNEQTGTGVLALTTVGPVTLGAGYFNQTNLNQSGNLTSITTQLGGTPATPVNAMNTLSGAGTNSGANDVIVLAALGNVGPVALDAWYLDMADIFDTYTVGAKAGFDVSGVALGANVRYTALSFDKNANTAGVITNTNDEHDMIQFALTAKAGIVDAKYAFAKTDKEGGVVALDNDAPGAIQGWSVNPLGKADASFHQAVVGVQALDSLHLSANYVTVKYDGANSFLGTTGTTTADEKETEIYAQAVYKMSSNLTSYVRFGTEERETDGVKTSELDYKGRLQVAYTF
jgi:hypothetical protein